MDQFTRLVRPQQAQIQIDATSKDSPSDGFNWPTFRLLNKQTRVHISPQPLSPSPSNVYRLLAVANSKGWFAAVARQSSGSFSIILSTLEDLRLAFKSSRENQEPFVPKRTVSLDFGEPVILAFSSNDAKLFVGFEQGQLALYDTVSLFSPGTESLAPLHICQEQSGPIRQISPNPGIEPSSLGIVAVVRANGSVALFNTKLELQGGWIAGEVTSIPVCVAWSPKGKHIAIGLQTGDILTYALTNKTTVNKHIPPTANPTLVSLTWLAPGHTFKTTYGGTSGAGATQHIVVIDAKQPTGHYFSPGHPFPMDGRPQQNFSVVLPRWDEDTGSNISKSLVITGDMSSVDLEVLGSIDTQWYHQSQENPLSLPLDKNLDDTMLLALDIDLTDASMSSPILYGYLNDGTVQAWMLDHTKPYHGILNHQSTTAASPAVIAPALSPASGQTTFGQHTPSAFGGAAPMSTFGKQSTVSFGSASFGQSPALAFGQTSQGGSTSAFGQASPPALGMAATSPFGQPGTGRPLFGQPSTTFSATSGTVPAFGNGSSFGTGNTFGTTGFGGSTSSDAFTTTPSTSTTGAFAAFANKSVPTNAFGQPSFGFGQSVPVPPVAAEMTREESMADDTPGFGGLSLGGDVPSNSDKETKTGIFGSLPLPSGPSTTFGQSTSMPQAGFGAFSSFKSTQSVTSTTPIVATASVPEATKPLSGFGQPSFGTPSFGQPSFGQPSFGQSGFSQSSGQTGRPATSANPASGGGFASFASASPTMFGGAVAPSASLFGGGALSSSFQLTGSGPDSAKSSFTTASTTPSGFDSSIGITPFVGQTRQPSFGRDAAKKDMSPEHSPPITPRREPTAAIDSDGETPAFPALKPLSMVAPMSPTLPSGNAFANTQAPSSVLKPATGFGAFGSDKTPSSSPFFKVTAEHRTPPVSIFGTPSFGTTTTPTTSPLAGATSTTTPKFGTSSSLGSFGTSASLVIPVTPSTPTIPVTASVEACFSPFGGSSTGFSAFAGPKKRFGELDDTDTAAPEKVTELKEELEDLKVDGKKAAETMKEKMGDGSETSKVSISAFPPIPKTPVSAFASAPVFSPPTKDESAEEKEKPVDASAVSKKQGDEGPTGSERGRIKAASDESFATLSLSTISSFDEIEHEAESEEELSESEDDAEGDAQPEVDEEYVYEDESEESFTSSNDLSDVPEEEEPEEGEKRSDMSSPEATEAPLPLSRSPSATPRLEIPRIRVTPSPSPSSISPPSEPSLKEKSTTPPGSPLQEPSPPKSLTPPQSAPSPPSFGLGRPSTRPTRSSPLASTPVSLQEGEGEGDKTAVPIPIAKPLPLSPKVVEVPLKMEGEDEHTLKPSRPKTPPLLSTLIPSNIPLPSSPILTPTVAPAAVPAAVASAPPNLFGQKLPATPAPPPSISSDPTKSPFFFGHPPDPSNLPPTNFFGTASQTTTSSAFSFVEKKPLSACAPVLQSTTSAPAPPSAAPIPWAPPTAKCATAPPAPSVFPPSTSLFGPAAASFKDKTPERLLAPGPVSLFGKASAPPVTFPPTSPVFGKRSAPPQTPVSKPEGGLGLTTPSPKAPPPVELSMEDGLQKECARLVYIITHELNGLAQMAEGNKKRMEVARSLGGSRRRVDLGNPEKWALEDVGLFGQTQLQFEKELSDVKQKEEEQKQMLREIQSMMLKAGTRKEEINRFNKAKSDKDFARMLKSRTLGPEHLETQTQLRRNIRAMRDRIQTLEDNLKASKKRLHERKTGRPSLRAPSIDTINRTYRNIDLAIQQQSDEVVQLTSRLSKLKVAGVSLKALSSQSGNNGRDPRLPDAPRHRRASAVTQHVASTTAAALNAERAAHRLKGALLAVRKEPLLNKKAAVAPSAPIAFATPPRAASSEFPLAGSATLGAKFKVPPSTSLFGVPWTPPSHSNTPTRIPYQATPPDDGFSPGTPLPIMRRGASTSTVKRHSPGVPFRPHSLGQGASPQGPMAGKAAPSTSSVPLPVGFSWGPLPTFQKASTSMVEAVRIKPTTTATNANGSPWSTGFAGFGK